jgi:hypothetical protein
MCAVNEHQGEGGKPTQISKVNAPGKSGDSSNGRLYVLCIFWQDAASAFLRVLSR